MAPNLIFGTATFGMDPPSFQDAASVRDLLTTLQSLNIKRLDTAARYPPLYPGQSESLIGETAELSKGFEVDTKIYTDTAKDGSGDLSKENMEKSVTESLQRLKRDGGVNVLYAHRADPETPLEEQIQNFNEQIKQGHCKAWGVSNVPPAMLEKILQLCEQNGWQKPSCYQGPYNVITRGMKTKLLPILRAHGMAFNSFQPLAAGFLTGKLLHNQHAGTRFVDDNPIGKVVQKMFGSEELLVAMKKFDEGARRHGLTPAEVAVRWLAHHSALREEDGIILGASRNEQIVETVGFIRKGRLEDEVVRLAEEAWEGVRGVRGEIM
ncbi:putative oxidoreductase [Trematosphaeria pertusa]|uniref:Putative oxidoreductase n=1 Tax=Trematosphaeria pertusa TaxID=390896 RepID=A0A6A6I7A2_9PLEO|nr:putative oxidoreductase [Trematosphaeria pertusa]KAF2246251.1 putative oxidoreductase [Trematosphaeria pertusa]